MFVSYYLPLRKRLMRPEYMSCTLYTRTGTQTGVRGHRKKKNSDLKPVAGRSRLKKPHRSTLTHAPASLCRHTCASRPLR